MRKIFEVVLAISINRRIDSGVFKRSLAIYPVCMLPLSLKLHIINNTTLVEFYFFILIHEVYDRPIIVETLKSQIV